MNDRTNGAEGNLAALPSDAAQAPVALTDVQILRLADACGLYGVRRGALAFAREVMKDAAPVAPTTPNHLQYLYTDAMEKLAPAFDYIQSHADQFGAKVGDCKLAIIGEWFPRVAPAAAAPEQVGKNALVLTGAQLLEALDFIAPDRATDAEQMEATVAIEYGKGHSGEAMYVWCAEYPEEGSFVLTGESAAPVVPAAAAPALFYNGDTKRDPELRGRVNASLVVAAQPDERAAFESHELIELLWPVWQVPQAGATLTDEQRADIQKVIDCLEPDDWCGDESIMAVLNSVLAAHPSDQGNRTPIDGDRNAQGN